LANTDTEDFVLFKIYSQSEKSTNYVIMIYEATRVAILKWHDDLSQDLCLLQRAKKVTRSNYWIWSIDSLSSNKEAFIM